MTQHTPGAHPYPFGAYAYPWDELTEPQQTARLDMVLDSPWDYLYTGRTDWYRSRDAQEGSPDFAPGRDVEQRRKYRDGEWGFPA